MAFSPLVLLVGWASWCGRSPVLPEQLVLALGLAALRGNRMASVVVDVTPSDEGSNAKWCFVPRPAACRYGAGCYKPGCWFNHGPDRAAAVRQLARYWQGVVIPAARTLLGWSRLSVVAAPTQDAKRRSTVVLSDGSGSSGSDGIRGKHAPRLERRRRGTLMRERQLYEKWPCWSRGSRGSWRLWER